MNPKCFLPGGSTLSKTTALTDFEWLRLRARMPYRSALWRGIGFSLDAIRTTSIGGAILVTARRILINKYNC